MKKLLLIISLMALVGTAVAKPVRGGSENNPPYHVSDSGSSIAIFAIVVVGIVCVNYIYYNRKS